MSHPAAAAGARGLQAHHRASQAVQARFPGTSLVDGFAPFSPGLSASLPEFIGSFQTTPHPPVGSSIVHIEFFAGIHVWAAAFAELGFCIQSLVACELKPSVRAVGLHHISVVNSYVQHPIPQPLYLPHDILRISISDLVATGQLLASFVVITNSWPCVYRSMAGAQEGVNSPLAPLIQHAIQLETQIDEYRAQHGLPPAYHYRENVPVTPANSLAVQQEQTEVEKAFGPFAVFDATLFDSYAHRLRAFSVSGETASVIMETLAGISRSDGLVAQNILDTGRFTLPVLRADTNRHGRLPVNTVGHPLSAFPTLVSRPWSYSFRGLAALQKASVVLDKSAKRALAHQLPAGGVEGSSGLPSYYLELNADERERAMGFRPGATRHPLTSEMLRRHVLGQAVDMNQAIGLISICAALTTRRTSVLFSEPEEVGDWGGDMAEVTLGYGEVISLPEGLTKDAQAISDLRLEAAPPPLATDAPAQPVSLPQAPLPPPEPPPGPPKPVLPLSKGRGQAPDGFDWESLINPKLKQMLPPEKYAELVDGFRKRAMAFGWDYNSLGCYTGSVGDFRLGMQEEVKTVYQRPRNHTAPDAAAIDAFVGKLLPQHFITPAGPLCQFAVCLNVQPKKDSMGEWTDKRICTDYRPINVHCPLDRYPMPLIETLLTNATSKGQNIFTTMDLLAGFLQCRVALEDVPKTAFWGTDRRLYCYTRMPFGLRNAPAHFQRCVDQAFKGLCEMYIDDGIASDEVPDTESQPWGCDVTAHANRVFAILDAAIANGFTYSAFKFKFGYESADALGHTISQHSVRPNRSLTAAIEQLPEPANRTELQAWLGLTGYYRKFIKDYAAVTAPLRVMLAADTKWSTWGPAQQAACQAVKQLLTSAPVLRIFSADYPISLATDWSINGMGAVLSQAFPDGQGGFTEHPVAFASRSCNKAERNYTSYKGEMLAVAWAVEQFKYQLTGRRFTLLTDHQPLSFLMKSQHLSGIYARWALRLQEFDFTITYRPGSANANADIISRFPLPVTDDHWERYHDGLDYMGVTVACATVLSMLQTSSAVDYLLSTAETAADTTEQSGRMTPPPPALPQTIDSLADIWLDSHVLQFIHDGTIPASVVAESERHRIRRRAASYRLCAIPPVANLPAFQLYRVVGSDTLLVPHPSQRAALVEQFHNRGHFGAKRTAMMLRSQYWWYNLMDMVRNMVPSCSHCASDKAVFNSMPKQLSPLPVLGIGFRIHVDLAGPFVSSSHGNVYFMVIIDAFSKWLEVVPIPDKTAQSTMRALRREWLCRFGSPAVVTTDGGREWEADFASELRRANIQHRYTAPEHPAANGQAERVVRTVKSALRKMISKLPSKDMILWEDCLPDVVMAYNFSVQESTRFSPYQLVFGRNPLFPSETHLLMRPPLLVNPDNADELLDALTRRAGVLRQYTAMAFGNLNIAQQRQKLYYLTRRDGSYVTEQRAQDELRPGQFAIMQAPAGARRSLDPRARDLILRVMYIRPNGVLVLQGLDGGYLKDNCIHWAPFHMSAVQQPCIEPARVAERVQRLRATRQYGRLACPLCDSADTAADSFRIHRDRDQRDIICDLCHNMYHLPCVKLLSLPADNWYCPSCVRDQPVHLRPR